MEFFFGSFFSRKHKTEFGKKKILILNLADVQDVNKHKLMLPNINYFLNDNKLLELIGPKKKQLMDLGEEEEISHTSS